MDVIAVIAVSVVSLVSLWFARGSAKQTARLLFCQQRADLILAARETRERLVLQAERLSVLQGLPLAPLDAAHVRSLWDTVNASVAELDTLRLRADEWTHGRDGRDAVLRGFDRVKAVAMQIARVARDVDAIEEHAPLAPPVVEAPAANFALAN